MKKILSALVTGSLLFGIIPTVSADDFNCGEWDDVPSSRMDILTEICEYGLMQGYSESNYGYGRSIVRPELAHVANRIAMGTAYYETELEELDWEDAYEQLENKYTDLPNPYENDDYEWLIEAMYFGRFVGLMTGDGDTYPTTYRPFDDINTVETFKVLYEAASEGHVFDDDLENAYMDYDGDPWWEALMYKMEDEGVIYHLDTEGQSFWLGSPLTISYSDFSQGIDREDAAIFLYYMIHNGVIDGDKLQERLDSPCTTDGGCEDADLAVTDIYLGSTSDTSESVYIEITNMGDVEIELDEDLNLQLYYNDDEPFLSIRAADLAEEDDDWLQPGGVSTFGPFDYGFLDDGTGIEAEGSVVSIRASMDDDEVLDESDEDNNWLDLELYY